MRRFLIIAGLGVCAASIANAEEFTVTMAGASYAPTVIEAAVGDVLVFVNDDTVDHDVFIPTVGFATDLGKQEPAAETRLTLGQPGGFDVECVIHVGMHARVTVRP